MARPKTVKLFGGEVILKNLPKDKQDLIVLYLDTLAAIPDNQPVPSSVNQFVETLDTPQIVVLEDGDITKLNDMTDYNLPMSDDALGLHKDSNGIYHLVNVKYNIITKQATVESVKEIGKHKDVANSEFRVKAAQKLMV
jgi:hypothetical protein